MFAKGSSDMTTQRLRISEALLTILGRRVQGRRLLPRSSRPVEAVQIGTSEGCPVRSPGGGAPSEVHSRPDARRGRGAHGAEASKRLQASPHLRQGPVRAVSQSSSFHDTCLTDVDNHVL